MAINQFYIPTLLIGLVSAASLLGCQHTPPNPSTKTIAATSKTSNSTDKSWSASTPQSYLVQTLTRYDWQLTQVARADGKAQDFKHHPPLIMAVRPDTLLFKEGCHLYKIGIERGHPIPYPYSMSELRDVNDNCASKYNIQGPSAIQQVLETIFSPRSYLYFNFRVLTLNEKPPIAEGSKQLALNVNNGMTLIFTGMPKPEQQVSGLPITNELLERYQWRIVNATDQNNQPITEFGYTEVPITVNFYTDEHRRSASFSSGCNGVSGGYALTVGQTLLIGSAPQTMIGCGDLINHIESKLSRTMLSSVSQLTLEKFDNSNVNNSDFPDYLLNQTLETGETFIWKNEKKDRR